jgi:hypothetical protein
MCAILDSHGPEDRAVANNYIAANDRAAGDDSPVLDAGIASNCNLSGITCTGSQ